MKKPSRTTLTFVGSLMSLVLSLHFGLTAHMTQDFYPNSLITDWGKVTLALVFGAVGCVGLASVLRK